MNHSELSEEIKHAVTVILAGGRGSRLKDLTNFQAKPAVDFGGKYRIIDFAMSNCLHSGFRRISLLTQYQSHGLLRHAQRSWPLNCDMGEFIDFLPAQQNHHDNRWYQGTADAVYQNLELMKEYNARTVLVLAGDHVYKMDYSIMLADHIESGADVTVACLEVPREEANRFGVMHVDENDKIISFLEKPADPPGIPGSPDRALASMGIYIFDADFLYEQLEQDAQRPDSSHDFGKDLIPSLVPRARVMAHRFEKSCVRTHPDACAYWRDVGTIDTYWESNLELTNILPELDLYDSRWPIFTHQEHLPPAKFVYSIHNDRGTAKNSVFSPGCVVCGSEIDQSLLSCKVRVDSFCTIQNSVLLPEVTVGRNAHLNKVVVDRGCRIPEGLVIGEDPEADARRFHRTDAGIVMVTSEMLQSLQQ